MPCDGETTDLYGTVVSTDPKLWCFELERGRTVYMPHLAAFNRSASLPAIGAHVEIKHAHFEPAPAYFIIQEAKTYYLCADSVLLNTDSCVRETDFSLLLELIKRHSLGISEFKMLLANIKNVFGLICGVGVEEFAFAVYKTVAAKKCLNVVSRCRFIDSKVHVASNSPYWSFGCHPSRSNEVLVGVFQVFHEYGLFLLSDCEHKILCVVKRKDRNDALLRFIDRVVVITKYVVFTEVLRDYSRGIDYLLCDVDDLILVEFDLQREHGFKLKYNNKFEQTFLSSSKVLLLNKSMPMLDQQNKPYLCLEIKSLDEPENNKQFYLTLQASHLHLFQFLQIGCVYRLSQNKTFEQTTNLELKRLSPHTPCYKLRDADAVFDFHAREFEEQVLTVEEALLAVKNSDSPITFQGVLTEKDFIKALSSRTKREVTVLAYGTPGTKTHLLKFRNKQETLIVYMNNWEAIQMPFGLLPGMRILVRYVVPQRRKYFKSTILTNFEVLNYEPKVIFETANLRTEDGFAGNWGNAYSKLGYGHLIPDGVLIFAKIETIKIRSLKIIYDLHEMTVKTTMTLIVSDSGGRALVICKVAEMLRLLLDIPASQWGDFCESVKLIGSYQYDKRFFDSNALELHDFSRALTASLDLINEIGLADIEMLFRKLNSKLEDNDRLPLWLCIEARKK